MKIKIIKPEKIVFEGEIELAQFPGIDGSFGILNSHAPMVAALGKGKIRIVENEKTSFFEINGGVVEVKNNEVLVLAE